MTKLLDKICKARDVITSDNFNKLIFNHKLFIDLQKEIHRQVRNKLKSYLNNDKQIYELDFTSQDLRELAKEIRDLLDKFEKILNPETNIRNLISKSKKK